jgi:hypothetical protein
VGTLDTAWLAWILALIHLFYTVEYSGTAAIVSEVASKSMPRSKLKSTPSRTRTCNLWFRRYFLHKSQIAVRLY